MDESAKSTFSGLARFSTAYLGILWITVDCDARIGREWCLRWTLRSLTCYLCGMEKALMPSQVDDGSVESRLAEEKVRLVRVLIDALPPQRRDDLIRELTRSLFSDVGASTPTEALSNVLKFAPRGQVVTAADLRKGVVEQGIEAEPKEIYNSISYLIRTGALTRLGYGRYKVHGMEISTSDDFGGEQDRHEDLSDDLY
ncbi:hypothetical protein [Pelagibacterium lentulum]|nr:hypothetical protein [Pelagibacterium lentulum]